MDRLRAVFTASKKADEAEYEPLTEDNDTRTLEGSTYTVSEEETEEVPFSWLEYCAFVLLGVAMLWSWYAATAHPSVLHLSSGLTSCLPGTCS